MRNVFFVALLLLLPCGLAHASVIVDAYYTWSGIVGNPAPASVGGLTATGTITLVNGPAGTPAVSFAPGSYYSGGIVSTAIDNFGVDAWVMATDFSQGAVAANGDGQHGWELFQNGGAWYAVYLATPFGNEYFIGPVTVGQWAQIATVTTGGQSCNYFNGNLLGCFSVTVTTPNGLMVIGNNYVSPGVFGYQPFAGDIAAVRVFEFAPGAFDPSTDLNDMPSAPEPATIGLAGLGAAGLLLLRRRRG
jgi:hypothetical protein